MDLCDFQLISFFADSFHDLKETFARNLIFEIFYFVAAN